MNSRFVIIAVMSALALGFAACDATSSSDPPGRFTQEGTFVTTAGNTVNVVCDHKNGNLLYVYGSQGITVVAGGCGQ